MTPNTAILVRVSFAAVAQDFERFIRAFRERAIRGDAGLAAVLPEANPLHLAEALEGLALILHGLDSRGSVEAKMQAFKLRQRWPRIQPHQFGVIGQALLGALSDQLGPAFRDEHRAAWADAFVLLAEDVMSRCYNPLGLVA